MKKVVAVFALTATLAVSSVTAFATPMYRPMYYRNSAYAAQNAGYTAPQQIAYDEATAVENYIAAQEARKTYLKDMYDNGIITKNRYDLSIAVIQENIDYVRENGLGTPYGGYGGCGGCWGW